MGLKQRLADWDGFGVICRHDAVTDAWIFIALHDDRLGKPVGGTRLKVYPTPEDGLLDAQRLAAGMTHKWAAIDIGFGGGKAVLALSRELDAGERAGLIEQYGRLLNSLGGAFATGQDLGTTTDDMLQLARMTPWVHGFDPEAQAMRDPGPYTALGVWSGMQAAARHIGAAGDDSAGFGLSVLIQGVGGVGAPLARLCAEAGCELILSDADAERAAALAQALSCRAVPAAAVYDTACDIYAPCAVGATLSEDTVPRLRCRVVAGSANNQLRDHGAAELLHARGILYAPDYVINAGGATAFGLRSLGETAEDVLRSRVEALGDSLAQIFAEAARRDESPQLAADRMVHRRLAGSP